MMEMGVYIPTCHNGITETRWIVQAKSIDDERTLDFASEAKARAWAERWYSDWWWTVSIYPVEVPDLTMSHFRFDD